MKTAEWVSRTWAIGGMRSSILDKDKKQWGHLGLVEGREEQALLSGGSLERQKDKKMGQGEEPE